jgi:hypothetical protein
MNHLTILIYIILAVGFIVAMAENKKKDTDYLKFPLGISFMILGLFYKIYPNNSKKLDLSFNDNDIFFICIIFSPVIIALIISIASPKNNMNVVGVNNPKYIRKNDRFMLSLDEAKKARFKGEWQKAISLYQDTLYYLENDYKEMEKEDEKKRQTYVYDCETSIRVLADHK